MRVSRRAALAASAAAAVRGMTGRAQDFPRATTLGTAIPPELQDPARNWPVAQGDLSATRAATKSVISSKNVEKLRVLWSFPIEASSVYGGMTATPLVLGDRVYAQDMRSNVFALDRSTGEPAWIYPVDIPTIGPNGVALGYGMLFASSGDTAEVFALDLASGAEKWRVRLSNNPGEGIDMAPAVYDSTVYISTVAGTTHGFNLGGTRGTLFALDASSGETLWQFDTTNNLWGDLRQNSGGGLWYPPSVDPDGTLYFGTANAAPWPGSAGAPNGTSRPGDNDYASSMLALDSATGRMHWSYNAAPHDLLDHDFQNSPVLLDAEVNGETRSLAVGSGKTGTVVAVDRKTGEVVWKTAVGDHVGDDLTAVPDAGVEVAPGAWGGVLTPLAAAHGLIFVPIFNDKTRYTPAGVDKTSMFTLGDATGSLVALDVATGETIWESDLPSPATCGATVINDLVVTGGLDGIVRYYKLTNGDLVSNLQTNAGCTAPPAVAGENVILPTAGPLLSGTNAETSQPTAQNQLITFGFDS